MPIGLLLDLLLTKKSLIRGRTEHWTFGVVVNGVGLDFRQTTEVKFY